MPIGPKGEKRPADVIGAAITVARIATGEIEETTTPDDGKDPNAKALVAKPVENHPLTAEQNTNIVVDIRWMKTEEMVMGNVVRGFARDAFSLGAVVSFVAMIAMWGEAIGRAAFY